MKMKIRKGDTVRLISGSDKGKQGKVLSVLPQARTIVVEGVNMKKKHVRPRRMGQKGELVRIPLAFPAARAMLLCAVCGKPSRVSYRVEDGKRTRTCKSCGAAF